MSIIICYDWYIYSCKPSFIKLFNCIFYKKAYIVPIPVAIETHFFKESDPVDFIARDVWTVEVKMVH